jgi:hypothetical protein
MLVATYTGSNDQLGSALIAGHLAQTLLVEALRLHLADRP